MMCENRHVRTVSKGWQGQQVWGKRELEQVRMGPREMVVRKDGGQNICSDVQVYGVCMQMYNV